MADVHGNPPIYSGVMKDRSKDYHQLNAGANRRQATKVRAPALTWHRAFWLRPPHIGGEIQKEPVLEADRLQKKASIDDIITSVWQFIYKQSCNPESGFGTPECHPKISRTAPVRTGTGPDVHLLFGKAVATQISGNKIEFHLIDWKDLARREAEIFDSENRVVSLKYPWQGMTITIRAELHSEHFILTLYAEFPEGQNDALIEKLRKKHDEIATYFENSSPAGGEALNAYFFREFWPNDYLRDFRRDKKLRDLLNGEILHNVFADFRGLIICNDNHKVTLSRIGASEELDWGTQIDKQCLQLFSHHDKYECTASYMLDGRAAYFTTLAPQIPEVSAEEIIPLEYVLYVHQKYELLGADGRPEAEGVVNRWQLGRLVDRIHLLTTVRLASLKYLPALRKAGATLSHLDSYANAAREAIDPENAAKADVGDAGPESAGAEDATKNVARDAISKVHSTFGKITSEFNRTTETDTGILYRIEQSRYYKEQFDKNLKALRIGRMEGYQRYDEFVERRLGPAFDFIDRLGRRYERATNNIATLDQNYLTMKIASIDWETNRIQDSIRKIQEWGEFVLLAVLVPYYVSHLFDLILPLKYIAVLTVMIWAIAFAFAIYRKVNTPVYPLAIVGLVSAAVLAYLGTKYH